MKELSEFEKWVLIDKGTEHSGTGLFEKQIAKGYYHCKKCDAKLYASEHKFISHCGWPSFDDEIPNAVKRQPDKDGRRTEIVCNHCGAHLGHIFQGESLTPKNIRHCVNSISMTFKPREDVSLKEAVFASGCFWGTQYFIARIPGVSQTKVGYIGGKKEYPTYKEVCSGNTGHVEAVMVYYDPSLVTYQQIAQIFFETHDFSQEDGQGPDIGSQYLSVVFPNSEEEQKIVEDLIQKLKKSGKKVATKIWPFTTFWEAEDYHQQYYEKNAKSPYCHTYTKIF